MKSSLPLALATIFASALAAQSATVTTNADTGAGSLRAAITAANAWAGPTFTIGIAAGSTSGPLVLGSVLPPILRSGVTIQAIAGAGRFVVDARSATAAGGHGLVIQAADVQVLAPWRLLVNQGNGVVVSAPRAHFADLELVGNQFGFGLTAGAGADDLRLDRFVADGFQIGINLQGCHRARLADTGTTAVEVRDGAGTGIRIDGGSDHHVGTLVSDQNSIGVHASNTPDLQLGRTGAPRSLVAGNRQQGVLLVQCHRVSVTGFDLLANGGGAGGQGLQVLGGSAVAVSDVFANGNTFGGLMVGGGAGDVRIAGAVTQGFGGSQDVGLWVGAATAVTVVGCSFGPGHRVGVQLLPEGSAIPTNVTVAACTVTGNAMAGIRVPRAVDALLCSNVVAANSIAGIECVAAASSVAATRLAIANCSIRGNAGHGLLAANVDGLRVGPGNRVDDNVEGGLRFYSCDELVVSDAPSIARNRATGIWLEDCHAGTVVRARLDDNRGRGVWALLCSSLELGPGLTIADTVGSGLHFEGSEGCRLSSSRITASTAYGVHFSPAPGFPIGTAANRIRSCLIADQPGIGLIHAGGPPVICDLSTVAGNLRGVFAGSNALTVDSCIVFDNLLEDVQLGAPALVVQRTFHRLPTPTAGSTNTNVDPQFVSSASRDWRLQATSPAIGYADPALSVPADALDAYDGPRTVGARDAGAFEVGPHVPPTDGRLLLSGPTMPNRGGGLAFHVQFPPAAAGSYCLLLLQVGAPSGSFPLYGGVIPLGLTPAVLLAANDTGSLGTVAQVDADGRVAGALLWGGRLAPTTQNLVVSLCAVALDTTPAVRAVSNVATFTIL